MVNDYFWTLVKTYNELMRASIEGPDCIDPKVCHGDCCSIKIDVPKILAVEYIIRGFANKNDFIRADVFSFHLRFDRNSGKCFLFDKKINGCSVHSSGIKPPQCWIYPTKFLNPLNKEITCKRAGGWKIINPKKAEKAGELLKKYVFLCQLEARDEIKELKNRLGKGLSRAAKEKVFKLQKRIQKIAPSNLGGFRDCWDCFKILPAEGYSLQMKKFCLRHVDNCKYLNSNFLECPSICELISGKLIGFIHENLLKYVKNNGPDTEGEYPLFKLFNLEKDKENT